jgi:hypothetical protein
MVVMLAIHAVDRRVLPQRQSAHKRTIIFNTQAARHKRARALTRVHTDTREHVKHWVKGVVDGRLSAEEEHKYISGGGIGWCLAGAHRSRLRHCPSRCTSKSTGTRTMMVDTVATQTSRPPNSFAHVKACPGRDRNMAQRNRND